MVGRGLLLLLLLLRVFALSSCFSFFVQLPIYSRDRQLRHMHMLGGVPDVQQLKCVAWCPSLAQPWTLAIGTGSGRIVLHDCTPASQRRYDGGDAGTSALCEFVPRFQRVCFSAAWNSLQPQQVAAGLDKVRSDHGVLVWDVTPDVGFPRAGT